MSHGGLSRRALVMFLLAAMLTACGSSPVAPHPPKAITIGLLLPAASAPEAATAVQSPAASMRRGVDLAIAHQGGYVTVGGVAYTVRFVEEDPGQVQPMDQPAEALPAAKAALRLISRADVLAVLGPAEDLHVAVAGELAAASGVPLLAPVAQRPALTLGRPFVFCGGVAVDTQGGMLGRFAAQDLKAARAGVISTRGDAPLWDMALAFANGFETARGRGRVVIQEIGQAELATPASEPAVYGPVQNSSGPTGDFTADISAAMAADPETLAVFLPPQAAARAIMQARAMGIRRPIFTTYPSVAALAAQSGGTCTDLCREFYFPRQLPPSGVRLREFQQAYAARYATPADENAALGYDAATLLMAALKESGRISGDMTLDRSALRNALDRLRDIPGVMGDVDMVDQGPRRALFLNRLNDKGEPQAIRVAQPTPPEPAAPANDAAPPPAAGPAQ